MSYDNKSLYIYIYIYYMYVCYLYCIHVIIVHSTSVFFFFTGVSLARQAQKDAKEAADRSEEAALMLMI